MDRQDDYHAALVDFVVGLSFQELPTSVIEKAKDHLLDALACAYGAFDAGPPELIRQTMPLVDRTCTDAVRPIGGRRPTSLEAAALLNGALIRYLDYNDVVPGGHPSDCLGALIAAATARGSSGEEFITSIVVTYEVFIRLAAASQLRERGWDQGLTVAVAVAAGTASLWRLSREEAAHAVAMAIVSTVPLRATRAGSISMWKGIATALAAQSGLTCVRLAALGITGPDRPFEGKHGLFELVTGPMDTPEYPPASGFLIFSSQLKYWPVETTLQAVVWGGIALRERIDVGDITSIAVGTYKSREEVGEHPSRWDPRNRETADHSLPYVLAQAINIGTIGPDEFTEEAYLDPSLRPLMSRISIEDDEEARAAYPGDLMARIRATTKQGPIEILAQRPLGHPSNPMSTIEIREKLQRLARWMPPETVEGLCEAVSGLEMIPDVTGMLPAAPSS